jgi:hypothetical protein
MASPLKFGGPLYKSRQTSPRVSQNLVLESSDGNLDISLGSLSELSYLLLFGRDRGLLSLGEWERLNSKRDRLGQLLWRLYRSIQQRARELN